MIQEHKDLLLHKYKNSPKGWYRWLSAKDNEYLRESLSKEYPMLESLAEKMFWLSEGFTDFPKCPVCNKSITSFGGRGYPGHCSCRCTQLDISVREKNEQTNMKRYGVKNGAQSELAQKKMKQKCMEKYGVENAFQSEKIKEKIKQINIERYGYDNPSKSPQIKAKTKEALMKRYGITCGFHNRKDYNISKGEKELFNFVKSIHADSIENDRNQITPLELDIFIPSLNIGIEYDGDYWHSLPNMQKRDILKNNICKHKNIKLIRVLESDWMNKQEEVKSKLREELSSSVK